MKILKTIYRSWFLLPATVKAAYGIASTFEFISGCFFVFGIGLLIASGFTSVTVLSGTTMMAIGILFDIGAILYAILAYTMSNFIQFDEEFGDATPEEEENETEHGV